MAKMCFKQYLNFLISFLKEQPSKFAREITVAFFDQNWPKIGAEKEIYLAGVPDQVVKLVDIFSSQNRIQQADILRLLSDLAVLQLRPSSQLSVVQLQKFMGELKDEETKAQYFNLTIVREAFKAQMVLNAVSIALPTEFSKTLKRASILEIINANDPDHSVLNEPIAQLRNEILKYADRLEAYSAQIQLAHDNLSDSSMGDKRYEALPFKVESVQKSIDWFRSQLESWVQGIQLEQEAEEMRPLSLENSPSISPLPFADQFMQGAADPATDLVATLML